MNDFSEWMKQVDAAVEAKVGLSTQDLPDVDFYSNFEDEVLPEEMANIVLEELDMIFDEDEDEDFE